MLQFNDSDDYGAVLRCVIARYIEVTTMTRFFAIVAVLAFAGGCAATQNNTAPTHRWVSSEVVSEMEYARDHQRCLAEAGVTGSARRLDASDSSYAGYTSCMNSQGYELTAFLGERNGRMIGR